MKNVAIITNGLSGGGAERVASTLANCFDNKGYKVMFIAAYSPEKEYALNENIRYEYVKLNSKNQAMRLAERSMRIKKLVDSFDSDVVFSFISNELIPIALSKRKLIPSLRIDPKSTEGDKLKSNIRKFVYKHSNAIVFQTADARDYFDDVISKKGVIIGNPIKENLPYWDEENHSKTFIAACRISKQKNIPMMINAFKRFHESHPDYSLDIYGDGEPFEYKDEMEQYANACGAGDYIHFMGHSKDIYSVMIKSQGLLLTSNFEGVSNSMLEAMAIGLPVICTDCPPGGARMFIDNEKTGMLIPVGGEDELVDSLCKLVDNTDLQLNISHNSRYVRQALNQDEICSQWEKLI